MGLDPPNGFLGICFWICASGCGSSIQCSPLCFTNETIGAGQIRTPPPTDSLDSVSEFLPLRFRILIQKLDPPNGLPLTHFQIRGVRKYTFPLISSSDF